MNDVKMKIMYVLMLCVLLASCNKLTQSNFDKIENKMTYSEVVALIGEPTTSDSIDIGGVKGTSAVWKSGNADITIQFLNGTVLLKTFSKGGSGNSAPAKPVIEK